MGNSWKAKGDEVQEVGRLAPGDKGLFVIMERISKWPERQRQGNCHTVCRSSRNSAPPPPKPCSFD